MRVILDTNVLIAALISRHSPPETIYRAWRAGRFTLVTCRLQLDELRRVSRYPKLKAILPNHRIGTMINNLDRAIMLEQLPALPDGVETADPDDDFLLQMAIASDADFLVTGDRRAGLLQLGSIRRARIVTPAGLVKRRGLGGRKVAFAWVATGALRRFGRQNLPGPRGRIRWRRGMTVVRRFRPEADNPDATTLRTFQLSPIMRYALAL